MKLNQKPTVLYIDVDENYNFIVCEILKHKAKVICARTVEVAKDAIVANNTIDVVFLCVDNIDHFGIVNHAFSQSNTLPPLVLISKTLDTTIYMYNLMTMYGALNYIMKPFSKEAFEHLFYGLQKKSTSVFRKRLFYDIRCINRCINYLNMKHNLIEPIDLIGLTTFDRLVSDLMDIKERMEPYIKFQSVTQPNILFVDETSIIENYRDYVADKPFHAFFSKNLNDALDLLQLHQIDLVLLDLGLSDGDSMLLLNALYHENCTDPLLPDVIVVSSCFNKDAVVDVINAGARAFMNKPVTLYKIMSMIHQMNFFRYFKGSLLNCPINL